MTPQKKPFYYQPYVGANEVNTYTYIYITILARSLHAGLVRPKETHLRSFSGISYASNSRLHENVFSPLKQQIDEL